MGEFTLESNASPSEVPVAGFVVDFGREQLRDTKGTPVPLRPRAWAVLRCLATNAGRVVTKDELLQAVWPGLVVTDGSLAQAVSEIREAMGDAGACALKTVPRRGYQLVVEPVPPKVRGDDGPYFLEEADRPSLAVLAFRSMGGDLSSDEEARALARDLASELGRNSDLRLVSHHASFAFAGGGTPVVEIGRRLGCRMLIDGQLRLDGHTIVVTLELLDSETATILWTSKHRTDPSPTWIRDAFVQSIARSLHGKARELQRMRQARPPAAPSVYSMTMRGSLLAMQFGAEALAAGRRSLEGALSLDADYAPAWTWLGYLNTIDAYFGITGTFNADRVSESLAQLQHAIELDPRSACAHRGLSMALRVKRDFEAALAAAERAVELAPSSIDSWQMLSHALLYLGRAHEALDTNLMVLPQGTELSGYWAAARSVMLWANRQLVESLRHAEEALIKTPHYTPSRQARVLALAELGRLDEARREAATLLSLVPKRTASEVMNYYADSAAELRERIRVACAAAGIPP